MASFVPRASFPKLEHLPCSYFLGHHRSGLKSMEAMLHQTDLAIECRDYRAPISSFNPLLDRTLQKKDRLIMLTKRDLGSDNLSSSMHHENSLRAFFGSTPVVFSDINQKQHVRKILNFIRQRSIQRASIRGFHVMIVGMPNVGKSSVLNALRQLGVRRGKVAQTGAHPGITRKMGTSVKILEESACNSAAYVFDTPGVFIPHIEDPETMLKLALCGMVKDSIVPLIILADYLLYQINLHDPNLYTEFSLPTNEITELLERVATKTGRLQKRGLLDLDAAAAFLIQRWRCGALGKIVLDQITQRKYNGSRGETAVMKTEVGMP